jgi:hypothetical protein
VLPRSLCHSWLTYILVLVLVVVGDCLKIILRRAPDPCSCTYLLVVWWLFILLILGSHSDSGRDRGCTNHGQKSVNMVRVVEQLGGCHDTVEGAVVIFCQCGEEESMGMMLMSVWVLMRSEFKKGQDLRCRCSRFSSRA